MNEAIQTTTQTQELSVGGTAFSSLANFKDAQRMAIMLSESDLVPKQFKGNVANCVIALEMANRIGASPLAVMQNLYVVHGKPAWSSQFLIACVNASKRFSPIRYVLSAPSENPREITYSYTVYEGQNKKTMTGKAMVRDQSCYCWATDITGERLTSPTITIEMAVQEGWYTKDGSKWKTMQELMLRYRSATLFARLYAPELTMGIHTEDEVIDISPIVTEKNITPVDAAERLARKPKAAATVEAPPEPTPVPATENPVDPETTEEKPPKPPKPPTEATLLFEAIKRELGSAMDAGERVRKVQNWAEHYEYLKSGQNLMDLAPELRKRIISEFGYLGAELSK